MVEGRCIWGLGTTGSPSRSDHETSAPCNHSVRIATIVAKWQRLPGVIRPARRLDSRAVDRRLARRNLRTALIVAVIGLLMFALTFVAALLYDGV